MQAPIVSTFKLHLLAATKSAPPENTLSTDTLVALLIIKTSLLVYTINFIYLPVIAR